MEWKSMGMEWKSKVFFVGKDGVRVLKENLTFDWLERQGKGYLIDAVFAGKFSALTAWASALDTRSLADRLAAWDASRAAFRTL